MSLRLRFLGGSWVGGGWSLRFLARRCLGEITRANRDGRRTIEKGEPANFFVYYEIDDDESKHNLQLAEHGHQEVPNAWVLLEKA